MSPRIPDRRPPSPRIDSPPVPLPPKPGEGTGRPPLGGALDRFESPRTNPFRAPVATAALGGVGFGGLPAPEVVLDAFFAGARRGVEAAFAQLVAASPAARLGAMAGLDLANRIVDGLPKAVAGAFERAGASAPAAAVRAREMLGSTAEVLTEHAGPARDALTGFLREHANGLVAELREAIGGPIPPAMTKVLADPVGFVTSLTRSVMTGLTRFADNVQDHLVGGVREWLLDAFPAPLREAIPERFDVKGVLGFVTKIVGLTAERVFERLDAHAPGLRRAIEEGLAGVGGALEGPKAAWEIAKDVLGLVREHVAAKLESHLPADQLAAWMQAKGSAATVKPSELVAVAGEAWTTVRDGLAENAARMRSFVGSLLGGAE